MPDGGSEIDDSIEFIENVAILGILFFELLIPSPRLRRFPQFRRFLKNRGERISRTAQVRHRFFVNQADVAVRPAVLGKAADYFSRRLYQILVSTGIEENLRQRVPYRTGALQASAFIRREGTDIRFGFTDEAAKYARYKIPIRGQNRVRRSLQQYTRSAHFRSAVSQARRETRQAILRGLI